MPFYLGLARTLNERKELVKFRIGYHKLMIEIGRYDSSLRPEKTLPYFLDLRNN